MDAPERFLLVAAGGALGAVTRYAAAVQFGATPLITFAVNISGSFLIGLLINSAAGGDLRLRLLFGAGFLGAYTTFSTLTLEALLSWREAGWWPASVNLIGSVAAGLFAVAVGFAVGGRLR
jgi:fluoride exporter